MAINEQNYSSRFHPNRSCANAFVRYVQLHWLQFKNNWRGNLLRTINGKAPKHAYLSNELNGEWENFIVHSLITHSVLNNRNNQQTVRTPEWHPNIWYSQQNKLLFQDVCSPLEDYCLFEFDYTSLLKSLGWMVAGYWELFSGSAENRLLVGTHYSSGLAEILTGLCRPLVRTHL